MKENETKNNLLARRQNRMIEFLQSGIEGNINRFPISGKFDPKLGPATPRLFVAYFPKPDQPSGSELHEISNDQKLKLNLYRRKIFELVIPQRIQYWEEDNSRLKRALERKASNEGYPTQVLVFARQHGSKHELIVLSSVKEVSAQTALSQIQNALRRKLQR